MSALHLLRLSRSVLKVSARRDSHGVAPHNPGPPTTYDHMPIPCQSYAKVNAELQAKFNVFMGFGLTMLAISLGCAFNANVFATECIRAPNSWYERK